MTLSDRVDFNALRDRFLAEMKPKSPEQALAVEQIVRALWTLRVLESHEAQIFSSCRNPSKDDAARRALRGVTALRSHYTKVYESAQRLYSKISSFDARRRGTAKPAMTNRESDTR